MPQGENKMLNKKQKNKLRSQFFLCFLIFFQFLSQKILCAEKGEAIPPEYQESWSKEYIPRNGHFLDFSAGFFASLWQPSVKNPKIQNFIEKKVSYSFHIPLLGGLSYFLGSSFGYAFDLPSNDSDLEKSYGRIILPGFLTGLSYNFSTKVKFNLGTSISWSRALGVFYQGTLYQFTMRTLPEVFVTTSYFLSPNWAISGTFSYKRESFLIEDGEIKKHLAPLYGSSRESIGALIGISFHKL